MKLCDVDVAIVGGGFAGSALAMVLARQEIRVALVDLHSASPPDFRAEKLTRDQLAALQRLGLADVVSTTGTFVGELLIARYGRLVERRPNHEYGFDYADLVNAIRRLVPPGCRHTDRVKRIECTASRQHLHLGSGNTITARLAVLATGSGFALLRDLGVRRVAESGAPSLAIGFDFAAPPGVPSLPALTYYGERTGDLAGYLTVFPIGERARANLFMYRAGDDSWSQEFRSRPLQHLLATLPGLGDLIGDHQIAGTPVMRPIKLYQSENYVREGAVLIGDAFASSCPAGGSGMSKAMTDVEQLAAWIPRWLATDGMGREKIAKFYADRVKQNSDKAAREMTAYARSMAIDDGLLWTARRLRNFHAQRLRHWGRSRFEDCRPRTAG